MSHDVAATAPAPPDAGGGRRPARTPDGEWVSVRVWDLPVRVVHWIVVATVVVLTVTGLYIGAPVVAVGSEPGYLMGWTRAVHVVSGWVLLAAVAARVVWAFRGTYWARWHQFVPWHRHRRRELRYTLRYYLFVEPHPPDVTGHNPLAGVTYIVVYLLLGLQVVSGFAMEGLATGTGLVWAATGWVFTVAPIPVVRLGHHIAMWLLLAFTVHHVYSAVLVDWEERSGLVSSIITGYKRLPRSRTPAGDGSTDSETQQ